MHYIEENTNRYLLIALAVVALAIAGLTVFYQDNFLNLNIKYYSKVSDLNTTFTQLLKTQQIANKTQEELLLKTAREQNLSSLFVDVRGQRDQLSSDKLELLGIKEDLETKLTNEKANSVALGKELNRTKGLVDTLQSQVDGLQSQLNACLNRPCQT